MRNCFRPKYIVLIGLGVLLVGVTIWAVLSNQQARLADVEWSITQRILSHEDAQILAPIVEEARNRIFYFYEIDTLELNQLFPAATFYVICTSAAPPNCSEVVAVQAGHAYRLPQDFNRLLLDAGIHITDENALPIARAFIGTAQRGMLLGRLGTHINFTQQMALDEADTQLPQYHYQWEIQAWAREFGTVTDWKIGFRGGRIEIVLRTLLGRRVGKSSNNAADHFSSGGISIQAIPRRDAEYYLCCSPQGQFLMTYSSWHLCCDQHGQLIEDASWDQAPSPSGTLPIELTAEWQASGDPERGVDAAVLNKAHQAYPDQVNETWAQPWSVEWISPALVSLTSGQKQRALFPGVPDQVRYFVQASPFSLTMVPSASYVGIVASQGDKVYRLPEDFNLWVADVGLPFTPTNQVSLAQAFIWATHRELVTTLGSIFLTDPKTIDETDPLHPAYHYQLEMDSWARERGVWVKWKFGFEGGRIAVVHYTVLGRFVGSWQSHLHPNVLDPFFTPDAKYFVCCDEKGALTGDVSRLM